MKGLFSSVDMDLCSIFLPPFTSPATVYDHPLILVQMPCPRKVRSVSWAILRATILAVGHQVEAQHQMWKVSQIWQTFQIWWYRMLTPAPEMTQFSTIYWRNCTVPMLLDVFNNLEILNTPLILVNMLLQDNNIFKNLTSGIMDSLTGFQD